MWLLVSSFDVLPKCLLFCFVASPPSNFSKTAHCLLFDLSGNVLETFGSKLIGVSHDFFSLLVGGFPHF